MDLQVVLAWFLTSMHGRGMNPNTKSGGLPSHQKKMEGPPCQLPCELVAVTSRGGSRIEVWLSQQNVLAVMQYFGPWPPKRAHAVRGRCRFAA